MPRGKSRLANDIAPSRKGAGPGAFGEFKYAAESWSRERRIVVKAEVVHQEGREPRDIRGLSRSSSLP